MADPRRILVVDDEADMVDTLSDILESSGYAVDGALSGQEALDRCRATAYSCVLMDVLMPGLDGMETLREIKRLVPDLPILLMTASVTSGLVSQATQTGARDVLTKPLDLETVLRRLEQTTGRAL